MKIAYLINQPQASQSFIWREIAALEAQGIEIHRFLVRSSPFELAEPAARDYQANARSILSGGIGRLVLATLTVLCLHPLTFFRALVFAFALGAKSDRGRLMHLAYFAEACVLRRWLSDCGVQHLHAHFGTNSTVVALLCRLLGGPTYSFTAHGPEEFDKPMLLHLPDKVKHAAFVIGVSHFGRSQLCRWAAHKHWAKIHVVHCGVDKAYLGTPIIPLPEQRRLICIGRLVEQKGQLLLVEAVGRLAAAGVDFEVVLVGDGELRSEITSLVAHLGLERHVRLTGWMSNDAVHKEILNSRALVLPSFAEGLPVVIMESLALGRPVVSTYIAGIPELVEPGVSGLLVPAGSVDSLVDAIRKVLAMDIETLSAMGRAGAARVAAQHNITVEAAKLAGLFRQTIGLPDATLELKPAPKLATSQVPA